MVWAGSERQRVAEMVVLEVLSPRGTGVWLELEEGTTVDLFQVNTSIARGRSRGLGTLPIGSFSSIVL